MSNGQDVFYDPFTDDYDYELDLEDKWDYKDILLELTFDDDEPKDD